MRRRLASLGRHLRLLAGGISPVELSRFGIGYLRHELFGRAGEYSRRTPQARYPLQLRRGSSDHLVFAQIFLLREYRVLEQLPRVDMVIDCGANIGLSAAFFLTVFPSCRLLAVEPDPDNFRMLRKNLAPYGDRARCLQAAVWSHPGTVALRKSSFRDGREWARQVGEEGGEGDQRVEAFDLPGLLERAGAPRISLLKMDIEGAEAVVFAGATDAWLPRIDALAVELHDDSDFGPVTPLFRSLMQRSGFRVSEHGELAVCRRDSAEPSGGPT